MSSSTKIEWTRSDDGTAGATWNPVSGCTEVSPGCDRCYAKTFAERWRGTPGHYYEHGFDVTLRPNKLDLPLRWTRPRRIFVNSMSDLSVGVSAPMRHNCPGKTAFLSARQMSRTIRIGLAT
jgi:protein gp37